MFKKATSKVAHNPTVISLRSTNQDLRLLQNLILAEKTVLLTLQRLSADYAKASEALRVWGLNEGDDLGGILTASTLLLNHLSSALLQYASHGDTMRRQLKAIRTRIENLDNLKRQRHTIYQKARDLERRLENMDPEHRNFSSRREALNNFRNGVGEMNLAIKLEEAALGDFKRTSTKMWMGLKFGGLAECCEKGAIAGRFGKLIIAEISEEMTQPGLPRNLNYRRHEVESCVANAHRGVSGVTFSTVPVVGFRDRDQYIHRSSDAPPSDMPPSDTPPAAFYISTPIEGYGDPSNNGPSTSLSGEPQPELPLAFYQPQCSCMPSALEDQPRGSRSSLPYLEPVQDTAESSFLPRAFSPHQQPEVSDGTMMDDNGVNLPSTVTDPVASPNTASSDTAGGQITTRSVTINVPAPVADPVASPDTATSNTAGGRLVPIRAPGTFGGTTPDPFSIRARSGDRNTVKEETAAKTPPAAPKPGLLSQLLKFLLKKN